MEDDANPYGPTTANYFAYKRGCSDTANGLIACLNRLRAEVRKVPGDDVSEERADAYLQALDDVAKSHGLRKQTTTTYVV
jgi:hypothetical protein